MHFSPNWPALILVVGSYFGWPVLVYDLFRHLVRVRWPTAVAAAFLSAWFSFWITDLGAFTIDHLFGRRLPWLPVAFSATWLYTPFVLWMVLRFRGWRGIPRSNLVQLVVIITAAICFILNGQFQKRVLGSPMQDSDSHRDEWRNKFIIASEKPFGSNNDTDAITALVPSSLPLTIRWVSESIAIISADCCCEKSSDPPLRCLYILEKRGTKWKVTHHYFDMLSVTPET